MRSNKPCEWSKLKHALFLCWTWICRKLNLYLCIVLSSSLWYDSMFTSYSRSQIFCNRSLIRERFGNDINCTPGSRFFFFLTPVNAMVLLAQRGIVHNLYAITCSLFLLRMRGITNLVPLLGGIHALISYAVFKTFPATVPLPGPPPQYCSRKWKQAPWE